jgi:23S rRNA pseudouridine1911/1915/1917 synthase
VTERYVAVIEEDNAGERLDRFLVELLPDTSRARAQDLISDSRVLVNGTVVKPSYRLAEGDSVAAELPESTPATTLTASPELPLRVLHEDEAIIVVDKPAGQVVHPALGHSDDTLVNALLARYPDLREAFEGRRPGIVHRLDADTSGVMVIARDQAAADALRAQFKARTVEKVYVLLAKGRVSPPAGVIEAPIGRDVHQRKRMAAVPGGREAQTEYRVLAEAEGFSWVQASPRTGRTHQIRVHMAAIGHPVAGDAVYGRHDKRDRAWGIDRTALHAWEIAFDHPQSGNRVRFRAPLATDLAAVLKDLGIRWPPDEV